MSIGWLAVGGLGVRRVAAEVSAGSARVGLDLPTDLLTWHLLPAYRARTYLDSIRGSSTPSFFFVFVFF
jgi:hypothetical protein